MAKNLSDNRKLYLGLVLGVIVGLAFSVMAGSFGKFSASPDATSVKNPSFEQGNAFWITDEVASNEWSTHGTYSLKGSTDVTTQEFVVPSGASRMRIDFRSLDDTGYFEINMCTEPVYVDRKCAALVGVSKDGQTYTPLGGRYAAGTYTAEYDLGGVSGQLVRLNLIASAPHYWDNIRIS